MSEPFGYYPPRPPPPQRPPSVAGGVWLIVMGAVLIMICGLVWLARRGHAALCNSALGLLAERSCGRVTLIHEVAALGVAGGVASLIVGIVKLNR